MATIACVIRSAAICLSMQSDGSYFFFKRINTLFLSLDFFLTSSVVHSFFSDFIFRLFLHSSFVIAFITCLLKVTPIIFLKIPKLKVLYLGISPPSIPLPLMDLSSLWRNFTLRRILCSRPAQIFLIRVVVCNLGLVRLMRL